MKNIKIKLKELPKIFFYKIFALFYGNIKGKINSDKDSRIKLEIIKLSNGIKYKIFKISKGRFYTDRVHDAAVILDNYIVEGPSFQLRPINNDNVEKNIVFEKGTPRIKKNIKGKIVSLLTGGGGNNNYFHWMFDVLPRLGICEKTIDLKDLDYFLVPNLEKKFQIETLDLLNLSNIKYLSSKSYRHIQFSEIYITDHPYVITNDATKDIQNIPIWISEWLKSKYIEAQPNSHSKFPKKIYIDRKDSSANTKNLRIIINDNDVKSFLRNEGFSPITLGNYHFKDQVRIFNNADFIIGLHGAGFANLCFCKPDTKVIDLMSNTAGKMYENLALTNGLIYKSISYEPENFKTNDQFGHINVSIKRLKETIDLLK